MITCDPHFGDGRNDKTPLPQRLPMNHSEAPHLSAAASMHLRTLPSNPPPTSPSQGLIGSMVPLPTTSINHDLRSTLYAHDPLHNSPPSSLDLRDSSPFAYAFAASTSTTEDEVFAKSPTSPFLESRQPQYKHCPRMRIWWSKAVIKYNIWCLRQRPFCSSVRTKLKEVRLDEERRRDRNDSKSLTRSSYITNNLPLIVVHGWGGGVQG